MDSPMNNVTKGQKLSLSIGKSLKRFAPQTSTPPASKDTEGSPLTGMIFEPVINIRDSLKTCQLMLLTGSPYPSRLTEVEEYLVLNKPEPH
jgi:hypothetical protein